MIRWKFIRIDIDPTEIATAPRLDLGLVGDARRVVEQFNEANDGRISLNGGWSADGIAPDAIYPCTGGPNGYCPTSTSGAGNDRGVCCRPSAGKT